jgi:Domain of unknown function (DUF4034)
LNDGPTGGRSSSEVGRRAEPIRARAATTSAHHKAGYIAATEPTREATPNRAGNRGESIYPFNCQSRTAFEQKREQLEQWVQQRPGSVAAAIALANFWSNAGWSTRGDGYADAVGIWQWWELAADLRKAAASLNGIDASADPHSYFVRMEIARGGPNSRRGGSNTRATLDALYAEAVRRFPNYYHFYSERSFLLQERWFGRAGELRTFSASLLQFPGGDAGLVAYSYVTYNLMRYYARPTLLQTTGLSWQTVKRAYATRERLYGLRNRDWNTLLNLSLAAIDRDSASIALYKIGTHWDPVVWKDRKYFDDAVAWTTGNTGLVLPAPDGWNEEIRSARADGPRSLFFTPQNGPAFVVAVTPSVAMRDGSDTPNAQALRASVLAAAQQVASRAVEKKLTIRPLGGSSCVGYYFSATDRAPAPGEWKYLTKGMARVDGVDVAFEVLTNDGQEALAQTALEMVCHAHRLAPLT